MTDNSWLMAFQVFLWGFSGVFFALIILMFSIKTMSIVIRGIKKKESTSRRPKE